MICTFALTAVGTYLDEAESGGVFEASSNLAGGGGEGNPLERSKSQSLRARALRRGGEAAIECWRRGASRGAGERPWLASEGRRGAPARGGPSPKPLDHLKERSHVGYMHTEKGLMKGLRSKKGTPGYPHWIRAPTAGGGVAQKGPPTAGLGARSLFLLSELLLQLLLQHWQSS